jgi:hypothetical protein
VLKLDRMAGLPYASKAFRMHLKHDAVKKRPGEPEQQVDRDCHADSLARDLSLLQPAVRCVCAALNTDGSLCAILPSVSSLQSALF